MVILVKSALEHFDRRQKIREKWKIDEDIRINFLIGKNLKNQVSKEVREEADRHKDLIIGDFIDTYRNYLAYNWDETWPFDPLSFFSKITRKI